MSKAIPSDIKRIRQVNWLNQFRNVELAVEVGVHRGVFSRLILDHVSPHKLVLVDPWLWGEQWHSDLSQENLAKAEGGVAMPNGDAFFNHVTAEFADHKNVEIMRDFSVTAAQKFASSSVSWVYLDGDHRFAAVQDDLEAWWPKVKPGGFITGDDFVFGDMAEISIDFPESKIERANGVSRAVVKFARENDLSLTLTYLKNRNNLFLLQKPK